MRLVASLTLILAIAACGGPEPGPSLQSGPSSSVPATSGLPDSQLETALIQEGPAPPSAVVWFIVQNAKNRDRASLTKELDTQLSINCNDTCNIERK